MTLYEELQRWLIQEPNQNLTRIGQRGAETESGDGPGETMVGRVGERGRERSKPR